MIRENHLKNALAISLFLILAALYWDGWWHITFGRESFWLPPHLLLYSQVIVAIGSTMALTIRTHERAYRLAALGFGIMVLMAPVDSLWHAVFGAENLASPLIVWSPPHLVAMLAALGSMLLLFFHWTRQRRRDDEFFFFRSALLSGTIFSTLHFLIFPLLPFGWHRVLGLWGVGIASFVIIGYALFLLQAVPERGIVSISIMIILLFFGFRATAVAKHVIAPHYVTLPPWLHFFAMLTPALFFDTVNIRVFKPVYVGLTGGALFYVMYLVFGSFLLNDFPFTKGEVLGFIVASGIGGAVAGLASSRLQKMYGSFRYRAHT